MNQTTVVNCKNSRWTVYIGRPSPLGNPYRIGKDYTRKQAVERYDADIAASPELQQMCREVRGEILGCWCKPLACHGDVIAKWADKVWTCHYCGAPGILITNKQGWLCCPYCAVNMK